VTACDEGARGLDRQACRRDHIEQDHRLEPIGIAAQQRARRYHAGIVHQHRDGTVDA
jgi:hypothetical protein